MFEQSIAVEMERSHRGWALLASLAGQTMAIGVAALLPLIFPDSLSPVRLTGYLVEPPPPPPPPFNAVRIVEAVIERAVQTQIFAGRLFEPAAVPERPAMITDEPPPTAFTFGAQGGIGVPGGVDGGVLHSLLAETVARAARVQGTVRLEGILGKDGRVRELRVISGHPLLAPAALEAVRPWIYKPTFLNGEPVEVLAPIDVNFTLN